jgi:hypothetical protein
MDVLSLHRVSGRAIALVIVGALIVLAALVPAWCAATGLWW